MAKENTVDLEKLLIKAINLLSYRPRSEAEMRFRLARLKPEKEILEQVVNLLYQDKLLNDEEFAQWWVGQRLEFRPRGNRALSAELMQKGIDRQIIAAVLPSKEQEKKLAQKLLSKKKLDKPRAQRLLLSRGFSPDIVYQFDSNTQK
jgi:regulatory protein